MPDELGRATGEKLDPKVHLLVGLGIGLIVLLPELRSRRAIAAVGLLGLAGVAIDGDIILFSRVGVRFGESALVIFGLPAALLGIFCWIERGSARTLGRTFSVGLLAVLPAQVLLDAAKGHEVALYYPISTTKYVLAFAEPGVAYSGLNGAYAIILMMTAVAAFVNLMLVADCRGGAAVSSWWRAVRESISAPTRPSPQPHQIIRVNARRPPTIHGLIAAHRSSILRHGAALRAARSRRSIRASGIRSVRGPVHAPL